MQRSSYFDHLNGYELGFRLQDVKIIINSHAHYDHAGGLAHLKKLTGAKLIASEADSQLLERGGKGDFQFGDRFAYEPVQVDRRIKDKDYIEIGNTKLQARITPGHTKGNTTWLMHLIQSQRTIDVVFAGSTSVPGYKLLNNTNYPTIVEDYAYSFKLLKSLPCDVFLAPHGNFFFLKEKMSRLEKSDQQNPFIDPAGYKEFLTQSEKAYLQQLEQERQSQKGDK